MTLAIHVVIPDQSPALCPLEHFARLSTSEQICKDAKLGLIHVTNISKSVINAEGFGL